MYRLWIKIFVWFWIAMVAVGAALIAIVTVTRPDWPSGLGPRPGLSQNWRGLARNAFAEQARRTIRLLNQRGEAAVRPELERQRDEFGIHGVVYDRSGTEVSGLPEPAGARQLARQAQRSGRPEVRGDGDGRLLVAVPARGGYTVVGEMPSPYGFGSSLLGFLLRAATVLLTGGLVCYLLSRHLTAPLASLQGAARRLADGDLDTRASAGALARGDEFGDLARDFDRMASRLQSLLERQQRLLGDISHELRSPLARAGVALELARERAGPEARGALDRIDREVATLDTLIGDLLQLSRLEREERLSGESVDVGELLAEIVDDASFEGSVSGRSVFLAESRGGTVSGSKRLLHSGLENVVRNALAFTPEGSDVEVVLEAADEPDWLRILVRDQGPGVEPQLLDQIFEPFYRADDARDVRRGGAGLGLAISRRIVQLHGGRMEARNRAEGGLELEITLPSLDTDREA